MISGVYKITNKVNNKIYIGSSVNIKKRESLHFYHLHNGIHANKYLQYSFNLHGEGSFIFEVIEYCLPEECIKREQYYIDLYTPTNADFGYNICKVAGSVFGRVMSDETKRKLSEAKKGWVMSDEQKVQLSGINKGKKLSYETKCKISKSQIGKKMSDDAKAKISIGNKGKPKSAAHRAALSESKKGKGCNIIYSEELRRKISNSAKNRPKISDETRKRLSDSHTGKKQSAESIEKRAVKSRRKVIQMTRNGEYICTHNSVKDAALFIGVAYPNVSASCSSENRFSKGFKFKYA